jgi:hypothetical protein
LEDWRFKAERRIARATMSLFFLVSSYQENKVREIKRKYKDSSKERVSSKLVKRVKKAAGARKGRESQNHSAGRPSWDPRIRWGTLPVELVILGSLALSFSYGMITRKWHSNVLYRVYGA